ncbi:MAG TPA: hypothetical protein VJP40_09000 [bacterium]|nr:hypothetical protein [bacterium]
MKTSLLLLPCFIILGTSACERRPDTTLMAATPAPVPSPAVKKGVFEKAGEKMDEGLHKTGEGLEKAGEKIEEGFDKAGEKLKGE